MDSQQLEYDFTYHVTDFAVDLPVLLISNGTSLLKPDLSVELKSIQLPPMQTINSEILQTWRRYLLTSRQLSFNLDQDGSKMVHETIVSYRKHDQGLTEEYFHLLLTIARLLGVSYFEDKLLPVRWDQVKKIIGSPEILMKK